LLVGICDILVFPDFILDSKTRMGWCKDSIFSLYSSGQRIPMEVSP
jgi:hypothetical protein